MKEDLPLDHYFQYSTQLDELFSYERYVSYNDLYIVCKKFDNLNIERKHSLKTIFNLLSRLKINQAFKIYKSTKNIRHKLENRDRYNASFVSQEQQKEYVSDNQRLDNQQIEAVVTCEDASLVLAPAGSGKTISLLAKIDYLVNNLKVPADKILAISFTRKTVKELKRRIGIKGVDINTFHSLGYTKILRPELTETKRIIQEKQIHRFIEDSLNELIENNKKYAKHYNDYLLFYYSTPIDLTQLKTLKETVEFNKSFLRRSLKSITLDKKKYDTKRTTLNDEWIKSKEEQIIANWLYINQIPYEYERQYEYIDTTYKPDFTLTTFNEPVYLEHFALQKDGTSHFENYVSGVEWKRKLHKDKKTKLIESYTYQWKDGTLLEHIENQIKSTGTKITRLAENEITKLMKGSGPYTQDIKSFHEILTTFLMLQKNGMLSLDDVKNKIGAVDNEYLKRRAVLFFEIYSPIYERYEAYLKNNKMIDFADMINRAIDIVEKSAYGKYPFEYILIDEVQDLSLNRYKLVKALLDKNQNSKLFAVGDDWQSIFRFAGGDLSLIQDFENTFELNTRRSVIGMTYRFGNPQLDTSSDFIQNNPYQSKKEVSGDDSGETPILKQFYVDSYNSNGVSKISQESIAVDSILTSLSEKHGQDVYNKEIHIISRYNGDIDTILGNSKKRISPNENFERVESKDDINDNDKELIIEWKAKPKSQPIKLTFSSMHKAKGITKDIVIILNMNAGSNGMPSLRTSDPLIEMLLSHEDSYPFAEERRLFYVSITRAKEATYVVADRTKPSQFLYEIFDDIFDGSKMCPQCQYGEVVERNGKYGKFYSCSNSRYGCHYTEKSY